MKKFKDLVKQNPEPARGKSGTNPMDPWNAKSGLAEASEEQLLHRYLKSRGINPEFIPKDTKIAHSKSSAYLSWRKAHEFDESVEILEATDEKDMVCFDIPLLIRVLEFTREDMKTDIELHNMVERLISMRETYPLTMKHYDSITQKLVKENHIAIAMGKMLDDEGGMVLSQLEQIERAVRMVRSYIGKDYEKQLPAWVQAKITIASDYIDTVGTYLISKNEKVNEETIEEGRMKDIATDAAETKRLNKMSTLQKFRADAAAREKKHDAIAKNSGGMTSAIDRLEKHMNEEEELDQQINEVLGKDASAGDWIHDFIHSDNPKFAGKSKAERKKMALGAYYGKQNEEVQQIDEISKKTVKSWLSKQPVVPAKKPGMDKKAHNSRIKIRSKSWDSAIDRLTDRKPTSEEIEPIEEASKKEWSKSARMIKSLYKKKGMKEETYDWEKDDKNMQVMGKKPKLKDTPDVDNVGENKPDARAVLTGGKTMTGEKRDDVEIDPFMKKPKTNTPDDFDKPTNKKDH
jgi:hypothetical protein